LPKRLLRIFGVSRRAPLAKLPQAQATVLSPAETAVRNHARMHRAAMARERRSVDGR
jgi:hypothetical protein